MRRPFVVLAFAGLALAWIVLFSSGVKAVDRNATLLIIGAVCFLYWPFRTGQTAPPLKTWHSIALIAIPCYLIFQVVPLPPALLETLSPARAALTRALAVAIPTVSSAPISVAPSESIFDLFGFLGYIATFLLIRDISWRFTESYNWAAALPLIAVAGIEAFVGLIQGFSTGVTVTGTYQDRDHFSAFLEVALPMSLGCAYDALRRYRIPGTQSRRPLILACVAAAISLLLIIVILESGSMAAWLVLSVSLSVTGLLLVLPYLRTPRRKWITAGIVCAVVITALVSYPPDQMLEMFSGLAASDKAPAEQLALWKEAMPVFWEFQWFGTGLGGFAPAFLKYQGTLAAMQIDYAHNDYLHYLVELGIYGFLLFLIVGYGILRPAVRGALFLDDQPRRVLAVAGIGCLIAFALRSAVDSNLAVPANAFAFAWISGMISANGLE